jgi:hypothetical protein
MSSLLSPSRRNFGAALLILGVTCGGVAPALAAETPESAKNHQAMSTLKDELAKLGKPHLDGDKLGFGAANVNGDFTVVDAVKSRHGCSATVFMKKGEAFIRVSTNVLKDGARAIGTPLDPSGPAYAAVSKGKPFYGIVDILGKLYDTGYEPIKSASGEVIGVYYVGYVLE